MVIRSEQSDSGEPLEHENQGSLVTVKVILMGELRHWAGRGELEVTLPRESTIDALAKELSTLCGAAFAQRALTKAGGLQPHVAVFVNGIQIGRLSGRRTILAGGKVELMLLSSYEGG